MKRSYWSLALPIALMAGVGSLVSACKAENSKPRLADEPVQQEGVIYTTSQGYPAKHIGNGVMLICDGEVGIYTHYSTGIAIMPTNFECLKLSKEVK